MGSMSILHWVIVAVALATAIVPSVKVLGKAGFSGWWVVLLFVPVVNIVAIWVFAFVDWPSLSRR